MENIKSETIGRKPINNQDRHAYYKLGEKYEDKFVEICQHHNIDAHINPEKEFNLSLIHISAPTRKERI